MTRFRKAIRTKRRKAAVIIALLALIPAGVFAYLDAHGTATITNGTGGNVSPTGPVASWSISLGAPTPTGSYLIPGGTSIPPSTWQTTRLTVTNTGSQSQVANPITDVTVSVTSSGGDIVDPGTGVVAGCLASWFTVTYVPAIGDPSSIVVPPGKTWPQVEGAAPNFDQITLAMPTDNTDNQSVCEGHAVGLTVTVTT